MGQYGRPNLALAGLLVSLFIAMDDKACKKIFGIMI